MRTPSLGVRQSFPPRSSRSGFLYHGAAYREAYLSLLDYLHRRCGIAVLSGETGTGKTTLLRHLWAAYEADPTVQCLFFAYPAVTWGDLVGFLCEDLQVEGTAGSETSRKLDLLLHFLHTKAQQRETVVLLLDDAHQLSEEVLVQLPRLGGAVAGHSSLVPIVLSGRSPLLEVKLRRPELAPLRRLVSMRCRLEPLPPAESLAFLHAYLTAGAHVGGPTARPDTLQLIVRYAGGVPATLVALCDEARELARPSSQRVISAELVQRAASRLRLDTVWEETGPASEGMTSDRADTGHETLLPVPVRAPQLPACQSRPRSPWPTVFVRLGDAMIVLLLFCLMASTPRVEEPVPPRPQMGLSSPDELRSRADEPLLVRADLPHLTNQYVAEEQPRQPDIPTEMRGAVAQRQSGSLPRDRIKAREKARNAAVAERVLSSPTPATVVPAPNGAQEQGTAEPPGLHGARLPRLSSSGGNALLKSAERGDLATVTRLLAAGVSPNQPFPAGWTPLMVAALHGHTTIVRTLLEHGADVDAMNNRGMTALMYAAWNRHAEIVRLLLRHGARLDMVDRDGWTALRYAHDTRFRPRTKKDDEVIAALSARPTVEP